MSESTVMLRLRPYAAFFALVALGLIAGATIWIASPWGIGIEYDSVFYWSAAENLRSGRGLGRLDGGGELIPLTHFPPLYPLLLLAIGGASGLATAEAARLASSMLFGLNVFLLGFLVLKHSSHPWLAVAAGVIAAVSPAILGRHLWAMSEPLYFTLLLVGIGMLSRSLDERRNRWISAAAVVIGLAALTRYAGISLIATGILIYLSLEDRPLTQRVRRAILFAAISGLPLGLFQLRNLLVVGSPSNRALTYHPLTLEQLREAGATLAAWIPYDGVSAKVRLAILAILALASLGLLVRRVGSQKDRDSGSPNQIWRTARIAGLHGVAYSGFLVISLTFFDASTRLRERILSPLFIAGLLVAVALAAMHQKRLGRWGRVGIIAVFAFLTIPYALESWRSLERSARVGLGFQDQEWRTSDTMQLVRNLEDERVLYSNEAFPIYYLTGRPAYWVPEVIDPVLGGPRTDFEAQLDRMRARLEDGAALVIFHPDALRPELPSIDILTQGLLRANAGSDGVIYLHPDASGAIDGVAVGAVSTTATYICRTRGRSLPSLPMTAE